jgi:hypothetical protein
MQANVTASGHEDERLKEGTRRGIGTARRRRNKDAVCVVKRREKKANTKNRLK